MKRSREAMNFFYKKHFKVSFLFSVFMEIGIVFFSIVKMFQGKPKPKLKPKSYILVSENENLREKLEIILKKQVKLFDNLNLIGTENNLFTQSFSKNQPNSSKIEVVFDQNNLDFKSIIQSFESNKNQNLSFKILPKSSDFLIGSNSSFDRGEVIKI